MAPARIMVWLAVLGSWAGCSSESGPGEVADVEVETTPEVVEVEERVTLEGGRLVVSDLSGERVALVAGVGVARFEGGLDAWNWDPWWLDSDSPLVGLSEMPVFTWREGDLRGDGEGRFVIDGASGRLGEVRVEREGGGLSLVVRLEEDAPYLRFALRHGEDELLYGAGNLHDGPLVNGRRLAMQLEADPELEPFYNERHVVVPLVMSSAGWGVWVENKRAQRWVSSAGRLEVIVGGPVREVRLHVFLADHPLDLYRQYYRVSGWPRSLPEWAYGPWIWRDETPGQGEAAVDERHNPGVMHDLAAIEALSLPTSAYWIDRPYATALNTFDFAADRYGDAAAMIAYARSRGIRMAVWHTPYVLEAAGGVFEDISTIEGFPEPAGVPLNTFGATPVDLTRPAVRALWVERLQDYIGMGIEGFKLDFAEDVVHGLPGARSNPWGFSDGRDERELWHDYARLYHETYREALSVGGADGGGFILARAGRAGGHAAVDVLWPGDLDADFARHGEDRRVGGIPAALSYALSTSASGYPYFAADTGGYKNGPPDNEAYRRWFELTSVMPVMQVGGSDNQVPWEAGHFGWDATLLDDYRAHASLHLRLHPFIQTLAAALGRDEAGGGRPLVRPLGLAHPECGVEPGDQYLLGEALLVAPVLEAGARSRTVTFPAGRWVSWWSGEVVEVSAGCEVRELEVGLGRVPLWIRGDQLVPMLRPGVQTLAPVTAGERESAADGPDGAGPLWVEVGGPGSFVLRDGARVAVSGERGDEVAWAFVFEAGARFAEAPVWALWSERPSRVTDGAGNALVEVEAGGDPASGTWSYASGRLQVRGESVRVVW